eukprot:gene9426-biopygen11898
MEYHRNGRTCCCTRRAAGAPAPAQRRARADDARRVGKGVGLGAARDEARPAAAAAAAGAAAAGVAAKHLQRLGKRWNRDAPQSYRNRRRVGRTSGRRWGNVGIGADGLKIAEMPFPETCRFPNLWACPIGAEDLRAANCFKIQYL